jgi:hypothetical protein
MDGRQHSGILSVMINPDALPQNKQLILARWAALYPEAFALAAAANSNTGLHLRRLNKARPNLAELDSAPGATPCLRRKGNDPIPIVNPWQSKTLV